jgi:hypothetical protein
MAHLEGMGALGDPSHLSSAPAIVTLGFVPSPGVSLTLSLCLMCLSAA